MKKPYILQDQVERDATAIPCPVCNGYADLSKCTPDDLQLVVCNRRVTECCGRVFVCRRCKKRILAKAEAPEME